MTNHPPLSNRENFYKALENLDISFFKSENPTVDEDTILIGVHKARYEFKQISREQRLISAEWLRERDYKGLYGLPLLPTGELPS